MVRKGKSESGKSREYPAQDFYLKFSGSGFRVSKMNISQTISIKNFVMIFFYSPLPVCDDF